MTRPWLALMVVGAVPPHHLSLGLYARVFAVDPVVGRRFGARVSLLTIIAMVLAVVIGSSRQPSSSGAEGCRPGSTSPDAPHITSP
jgi:hypothetical protein